MPQAFRRQGIPHIICMGLFFSLSGRVHDLERGASSKLLLHICHNTHGRVLVSPYGDRHERPVGLAFGVALRSDEVADVVNGLEGIVQLNPGVRSELCLKMFHRRTYVDIGGQVLPLQEVSR